MNSSQPSEQELDRRPSVPELDELLGIKLPVLDDGFVRLVDYMGDDSSIVQAARVSFGAGTKRVHEDRGLIRYLMRHRHTTPFEMCELKLHVRVPMDCWRQWIRHRTANVNEYSTRYSVAIDSAQVTDASEWRLQSDANRQGSKGCADAALGQALTKREADLHLFARNVYEERINAGIAREQARKDLPLATYTEAYWKCNLHNLFHFLALRMDTHAQQEIRTYARCIGEKIVSKWCPLAWEAFLDYQVNAVHLTALESEVLRALYVSREQAISVAVSNGLITIGDPRAKPSRERIELEAKLMRLGLPVPWADDGFDE